MRASNPSPAERYRCAQRKRAPARRGPPGRFEEGIFQGRNDVNIKQCILQAALAGAVAFAFVGTASAGDIVGLITKTEGNPFFVKMREGAQEKAKELGLELRTFAGKYDGDNES